MYVHHQLRGSNHHLPDTWRRMLVVHITPDTEAMPERREDGLYRNDVGPEQWVWRRVYRNLPESALLARPMCWAIPEYRLVPDADVL